MFVITQLLGFTATEHLLYRMNDIRAKRILVLGQITLPMLLEYLFYSEAAGTYLLYHKQDYIKQHWQSK